MVINQFELIRTNQFGSIHQFKLREPCFYGLCPAAACELQVANAETDHGVPDACHPDAARRLGANGLEEGDAERRPAHSSSCRTI